MPKKKEKEALEQLIKDQRENALKEDLRDARRQYKKALKVIADREEMLGFRRALAGGDPLPRIKAKKKSSRTKDETCPVHQCGDWHVEEHVDASTVEGYNGYDLDIARQRAATSFIKSGKLITLWKNLADVNGMILHLGGDHISGYIHEELQEENPLSPLQATRYARSLIIEGIDYLLGNKIVKNIKVVCSFGNHGRTTKRIRFSTGYKNSYEFNMYLDLEEHYRKNSRVRFIISPSRRTMVDVYGYKLRFHHGDSIRYYGGIGGKVIPVKRLISQWNKKETAHMDFFGHFHEYEVVPGFYVSNGSLIGITAYSDEKFAYQAPQQALSFIAQHRGFVGSLPIFVDDNP